MSRTLASVPFFLPTPSGRCFAIHHRPAGTAVRGALLFIMPFNEEMNRCRSMVTLTAQSLAQDGWATLVVDVHGTGDSDGEFSDARWEIWLDDLRSAAAWLPETHRRFDGFIGIRLGALLGAEAFQKYAAPNWVFWQPVVDGKMHLTQFLRIRIAAAMDLGSDSKETTQQLRERLAQGETVSVAGYDLHPQLAHALDTKKLKSFAPVEGTRVAWLEHTLTDSAQASPASEAVLEEWRRSRVSAEWIPFEGAPFWNLHERATALELVDKTREALAGSAHEP